MGYASTKRILELGGKVAMVYRSDEKAANQAAVNLSEYNKQILLIKADVANADSHQIILDKTIAKFNEVHVLVNNAGFPARASFLKLSEEEFDSIIAINLKGPTLLAKVVAEKMIEQGNGGSIINFSSISGHRSTGGISYDIAKAGLIMATKAMANALGKYGIRVNSISPGMYKTEMNRAHWENNTAMYQNMAAVTALGRGAEAEEIAGTVVYLASEQSSYVTGTDIIADGGFLCHCPGRK